MIPDQFFGLVGQLVTAGGGGALVAFALFRFLGRNWIEHELAKKLEAAKAEIGLLAARRMKLPDREYIVFPEVWAKLNKAVGTLGAAIISFRQFPDFNRQTQEERDVWLARSDMSDEERDYFARESDKIRAYSRILDFRALRDAGQAFNDFRECFHANRIFISPAIKSKLDEIDDLIKESWIAKKMDLEGLSRGGDTNWLLKAHDTHEKQIKPLMLEIEGLVQGKLFPEG